MIAIALCFKEKIYKYSLLAGNKEVCLSLHFYESNLCTTNVVGLIIKYIVTTLCTKYLHIINCWQSRSPFPENILIQIQ